MKVMLLVIFTCVVLGLLAERMGRRERWAIAVLATLMTTLYYFRDRYM